MTVTLVFVARFIHLFFSHLVLCVTRWWPVRSQEKSSGWKMSSACLKYLKVHGCFCFYKFSPNRCFRKFLHYEIGLTAHWHFFSFFVHKKKHTQETSFMSFALPEINRRINEMQNKMKVRNFSEQEKRSWSCVFVFSGMCWIVCYRQTMQRECELRMEFQNRNYGELKNVPFLFNCTRITCYNL